MTSQNKFESFNNYYLGQPSKCFSCEAELPKTHKYLGGPSKCFDCEKQIAQKYGSQLSDFGQSTKCFDCEKQFGQNPLI